MTKKNTLSTALATAAGKPHSAPEQARVEPVAAALAKPATVLIAAHFAPEVRRVLKLLEADTGKNLKELLGEAINDLAAKHGKPEPYTGPV
jgi:hypothetical protein